MVDYNKNISEFTKHSSENKQLELWQEVATRLFQELAKNDGPRWLSTHGGGVPYLHVRIYNNPKYYSHAEYKKFDKNTPQHPETPTSPGPSVPGNPIPGPTGPNQKPNAPTTPDSNSPIEKIIRNIEKVGIDPLNYLTNAELLKNQKSSKGYLDTYAIEKGFYRVEIEGEEIDLKKVLESESNNSAIAKISQAIIKQNPTDWEILPDEASNLKICRNKKTGLKHWQPDYGWLQFTEEGKDTWKEIESAIKNPFIPAPNPSQKGENSATEKKWYKPTDYPGAWVAATFLLLFLIIISVLVRNSKEKKTRS